MYARRERQRFKTRIKCYMHYKSNLVHEREAYRWSREAAYTDRCILIKHVMRDKNCAEIHNQYTNWINCNSVLKLIVLWKMVCSFPPVPFWWENVCLPWVSAMECHLPGQRTQPTMSSGVLATSEAMYIVLRLSLSCTYSRATWEVLGCILSFLL